MGSNLPVGVFDDFIGGLDGLDSKRGTNVRDAATNVGSDDSKVFGYKNKKQRAPIG